LAVVKRKKHARSKKVEHIYISKYEEITAIGCAFAREKNLFLVSWFWMSEHSPYAGVVASGPQGALPRRAGAPPGFWRGYQGFPPFLYAFTRAMLPLVVDFPQGAPLMEWVTPQHEEIDLNCEVSSYANAEL
jgi:hypothetical protein